ncbi:lipopolysaccharide-induced tumor necrosis factor-alpha factor [Vespula maculifrons]|uniref:Lipopolysaccharide-induced tumor necrosis factor-alpha factor n=1 Tax=Vespula maculifrons TaxID=7453 RepID=A0ABD2CID7_VESMC
MNEDLPSSNFIPPPPYYLHAPPPLPPPPPPPPPPRPHIIVSFGKKSQLTVCTYCGARISTRVETEASIKTHLIALFLCLIGACCCAPIPYCIDSCLIIKHYCPLCNSFLGQVDNLPNI